MVSIKVSRESYNRLVELKGLMEARLKRPVSIDEVIKHLAMGPVKVENDKITYRLNELAEGIYYRVNYKGDTLLIGREGNKIIILSVKL